MSTNINGQGAKTVNRQVGEIHDIVLPNQHGHVSHIAVDIGGTLSKIVYFTTKNNERGGRLNFTAFETDNIDSCIDFIATLLKDTGDSSEQPSGTPKPAPKPESGEHSPTLSVHSEFDDSGSSHVSTRSSTPLQPLVIRATGGGAHLFRGRLESRLGVKVQAEDEMSCLITGLNFFIREVSDEVFSYSEREPMQFENTRKDDVFPYMLVNIGSGVSILKVTGENNFERISGTSLGGGTLWGLLTLLTGAKSFDEMLELSKTGDNSKVDMMVGDIYGSDYNKIGLKATAIASTMAGVYRKQLGKTYNDEDIARSLLYMVSNNIGQIAYLNAQLHDIDKIYFGGYFIRGHPLTMHTLSYAINFWSKGKMKALFLRHEGYLGATGAFVKADPSSHPDHPRHKLRGGSFCENFTITQSLADNSISALGMLDRLSSKLVEFSKLDNHNVPYTPDTLTLGSRRDLQDYWLNALEKNTENLLQMTKEGRTATCEGGEEKMNQFKLIFCGHLATLRNNPSAYGELTVRSLMSLREQCLHEVGIVDMFSAIKKSETESALLALPTLLNEIDSIDDESKRVEKIIQNVLAGNMFDWGSNALHEMLRNKTLDFEHAKSKIQFPAMFNNTSELVDRLVNGKPYKKAVIFTDNAGADITLGVLPFARYLNEKGTAVILAPNSKPALNDITESELVNLLGKAKNIDSKIKGSVSAKKLVAIGTGSSSPCLDLRRLDERLVSHSYDADLVVIVGMGRAIHTNFYARFTCDSIKLAVFKNFMAAQVVGAHIYDAMCLYTPASATIQLDL
ncbi:hypothetical protein H4219_001817 [Mycoemilia scoparia]|uniref:pantothenate kinase n=1 Tax=Mycoemilia scoparia TaxID=417184 RepID=A0A9W8DRE2_9FUNG|nr:hypothetical protein H4219_001817 [Mycoemilia scoparia]